MTIARAAKATITTAAAAMLLTAAPARATAGDLAAYLRARVADADGAVAVAVRDYARALDAAPGSVTVALRAYREAVRGGDDALADRAAATLATLDAAPSDTALLALASAARRGDGVAATTAIDRLDRDQLRVLAAPLRGWAALAAGGDALAPLAAAPRDAVSQRFAAETRALLLIATGRSAEGVAALRASSGGDLSAQDERVAAARLLIGQGRTQAAAELIGSGGADTALHVVPTRGAAPTLAFGVSHLFTRVAADLASGEPGPLTYTLLRGALRADPGNDRARLLLAGVLASDDALDAGLAELAGVSADSGYAQVAATGRVQMLADAGREEEALAALRRLEAGPDASVADLQRLADLNMRLDRPAEAAPLYARLVERAGTRADWADWLQYGAALDRAGRWPEARAALEKAVARGRAEPLALNYLGYALIQRGERMGAAQKMLERAAALKPDDAAIADSLGWALLRRGQTARALPLIERAAQADPVNAEIGEHLGDLYWRTGRRFEARYAWTAARQTAAAADRPRLDAKIAGGVAE